MTIQEKIDLYKESVIPDVMETHLFNDSCVLDLVGMSNIKQPILIPMPNKESLRLPASINAYVNLGVPEAKGIHMSRLFLTAKELLEDNILTVELLQRIVKQFVASQSGLSKNARLEITFENIFLRKSLVSDNVGWRAYPATLTTSINGDHIESEVGVNIMYSSTCPCSAALARQLIQKQFEESFNGNITSFEEIHKWLGTTDAIVATPHSQRSVAELKVKLGEHVTDLPIYDLVNEIENCLCTAVQAVVKRDDEQEFARLNGRNLMFCEDAARRIYKALSANPNYDDFWARVDHLESLHAHDATCVVTKGVQGGYRAY